LITQSGAKGERPIHTSARSDVGRYAPAFSAPPDLERTFAQAAEAFVPTVADACLIYSFEGGMARRELARAAAGPEAEALADHPNGWSTTLPLRSRDVVWGEVVLLRGGRRPEPNAVELRNARELVDRAGAALEHARLYAEAVQQRARFAAAFEHAPSGMALVRADVEGAGTITEANPALAAITGRRPEELVGVRVVDLHHPDDRPAAAESERWLRDSELEPYAGERRFQRSDGQTVWVQLRAARLAGTGGAELVLQVQDVTERRRYEAQLQYLADHDPLTRLYNRRRFAEEVDWVVAYSRRYGSPAAVLVIDIDNFKFVNDTFGHATGDELLAAIGETLRTRCRETDIAGRLGGDEFGVIMPQSTQEDAGALAASLLEAVRTQVGVTVGGRIVRSTVSIGVRLIGPDTTLTAEELLSDADIALYDAKETGRDRLSVTTDEGGITDRLRARIGWSERIRDALLSDAFELFEQPIVAIETGHAGASEILLRMRDAGGSLIAPGEFLDVAERFGQIQAIDCWVISRAVRLLAERQAAGIDLQLEVNLSGGSITDPTVVDFVVSEVRNAPIDPTRLTIEVTETAAIVNIERARSLAQSLADLGCRFALDDFGSGFGSFYYLKHLPFDVVKIDGEFVRELTRSRADRLTVRAIVQIARGLGKPTIGERVEDAATLELLRRLGVDYAQGYHLGKPRPVVLDPMFEATA
jgi:diguanylate cyclase (GGDEF)-like protein/PAS domain S-box-containing protein